MRLHTSYRSYHSVSRLRPCGISARVSNHSLFTKRRVGSFEMEQSFPGDMIGNNCNTAGLPLAHKEEGEKCRKQNIKPAPVIVCSRQKAREGKKRREANFPLAASLALFPLVVRNFSLGQPLPLSIHSFSNHHLLPHPSSLGQDGHQHG